MRKLGHLYQSSRRLTTTSLPIIFSQIGNVSVNIADSLMVAKLGVVPLAACGLSNSIIGLFQLGVIGVSYGVTPFVAWNLKTGKNDELRKYHLSSLWLNISTGCLFALSVTFGSSLLRYLGQEEQVIAEAVGYISIIGISLVPLAIFQHFRQFLEGMHILKQTTWISLTGNILNILFNYILIFGKFGFPELGLLGAGLATLAARIMMALAIGIYFFRNQRNIFSLSFDISFKHLNQLLSLGIPTALQFTFEVSAFAFSSVMAGWLGTDYLASHQIALNISSITYMIATGVASAATIAVGKCKGENLHFQVKNYISSSMVLVVTAMSIAGTLILVFRESIINLYTDDINVLSISKALLIFLALYQISDGVQVVGLGISRGLGDSKTPTLITILAYWCCAIPIAYYLGIIVELGITGIWIGLFSGLTISAILLNIRIKKSIANWKNFILTD